ncbi:unnamed protein product [Dovyalis caffra]|uniref:2Fe-2S ferredoxin-type domain-containing protein n=1 Tax=Dovyalis caffra TaxID=77055 RepID=A0AAV1SKJ4_9ROSI|nr:unnamed protein product [Dovyalis caffra]
MAAINLGGISLRMPELSHGNGKRCGNCVSVKVVPRKRLVSVAASAANSMQSSASVTDQKPEIELEFIGPKPEADGKYPVERAKAISGEKLLRNIMLDNKIELYATFHQGKVMNCGGGGSCGTCIVEILDGKDLLNERTNTELRYLKKTPSSVHLYTLKLCRNLNLGGLHVKQLLEIKKTLASAIPVVVSGCGSEDTAVEKMIRSNAWSMTEANRTL